jgi:hypothetical protein
MGDIDNEDRIARPADKDGANNSSGAHQLPSAQTANTGKQAEEAISVSSRNHTEHETSAVVPDFDSEPEETMKIKSAIAVHSKMAISRGEAAKEAALEENVPPYTKLSANVSIVCTDHGGE